MAFIQFIFALAIVFAIGMLIRRAVRKGKKSSTTDAPPPPQNPTAPSKPAAFCPQCGQPSSGDSAFCSSCGAKL